MGAFRFLASLVFVLLLPVSLITTNLRFLVHEPRVYIYSIDQYDAVRTSGIDRDQLLVATDELRAYFNNGGDEVPQLHVQQAGRDVPLFTPREVAHLRDIRDRFRVMDRVQEFSVMYVITFIALAVLWSREITLRGLAMRAIAGSVLSLGIVGAVGGVAMAGFDDAWLRFHELLFPHNDYWLLNPLTDHLIQIFPPEFMQSIIFFAGLVMVSEAALMLIVAGIYMGVSSHESRTQRLTPSYAR